MNQFSCRTIWQRIVKRYGELPVQVRASFWFLICTFTNKAISVLTTPIFTRLLTTAEYGEYNVYTSWMGIFNVFVSLNLSLGVFVRGLIKFEEDKESFSSSLQFLTFLLTIVWISIYLPFSDWINGVTGLNTVRMLLMFMNIWLSAVFGFWAAKQRVDYQYRKLVPITILVAILGQLLGIVLVRSIDDRVTGRIAGTVIVDFVFYIWLFFNDIKRGKKLIDKAFWKYALLFNVPLIPHYLSQTILNSSDKIMINKMIGSSEAGIYGLAYSVAQVMVMFNTALAQTEEPWLYRKIKEERIEDIKPVAYISFGFIATANILLIAFAPEIVRLFAPVEYYEAIWVIPPVAMSVFFSFSYYFFAVFEYYYEQTKLVAAASCIGAALNILLNYIFIPIYGYIAAGYTTLACFIIYTLFHYIFMRRICIEKLNGRMPFDIKRYFIIAVIFVGVGFIFLATYQSSIIRYCLLIFMLVAFLMKRKAIINEMKILFQIRKN